MNRAEKYVKYKMNIALLSGKKKFVMFKTLNSPIT